MSRKLINGKMPVQGPNNGRPKGIRGSKDLTPELIEKICAPLVMGLDVHPSAALQGVSYDTLRNWIIQGHEHPNTVYGDFLRKIQTIIATWEARDVAVLEAHAQGRPATYEMEVVRDKGKILMVDGKPLMQVARDSKGDPIIKTLPIKSDWRVALERLARKKPKYWRNRETVEIDAVLTFDNREREVKPEEALGFDQRIAAAMKKLEEDF